MRAARSGVRLAAAATSAWLSLLGASAFADSASPAAAPAGSAAPAATPPAEPSLSDTLTGQAKDDYETGKILVQSNDYGGALVKFRHAFDVTGDVRLLWNVAACEKNLRHYVQVRQVLERYLRDGGTHITGADRDAASAVLHTVRSLVGAVRLTVNEPGATVTVDDAAAGTTPLAEPLLLDLGDHRIKVSKAGFKDQTVVQNIAGGSEATVSLALERQATEGHVSLTADAADAIRIDGASVGVGRYEGNVPAGTHTVEVSAPGMRTYSAQILLKEGETRTMEVALQHESSGGISPLWW
ncbi:MAG: PEGA domain-containing protein, partial [Polyangiaceae bacterium]